MKNELFTLIRRATLVGGVVNQCPRIHRWESFNESETLWLLNLDEIEKVVSFHRPNNYPAIVEFSNIRTSQHGRTEHIIRIGKMVDGELNARGSASWRTFAEFIHAMNGVGNHDLSDWFRNNPISDEMKQKLEAERNYPYDIRTGPEESEEDEES